MHYPPPITAVSLQRVFQSLDRQLFHRSPDLKTGKCSWTPKQIFEALVNVDGGVEFFKRKTNFAAIA